MLLRTGISVRGKCDTVSCSVKEKESQVRCFLLDIVCWLDFSSNQKKGRKVTMYLAGVIPRLLCVSERCN